MLRRQGFTYVLEANEQLRAALKALGPERAVDMDDAAQRVSMEVPFFFPIIPSVASACYCGSAHGSAEGLGTKEGYGYG